MITRAMKLTVVDDREHPVKNQLRKVRFSNLVLTGSEPGNLHLAPTVLTARPPRSSIKGVALLSFKNIRTVGEGMLMFDVEEYCEGGLQVDW